MSGSVLTSILGALLALLGSICAGFGLYLVTLAIAARGYRQRDPVARSPSSRVAVLVPAHDEQALIRRCVKSLLEQAYPRDLLRVVVVADNCSDDTAAAALAAGAEVLVRNEPHARGKGQAMRWAMDRLLAADSSLDAVVVVDADSIAHPQMLASLERELACGHDVVQADYRWLQDVASPRSDMIAAGFLLFHRVRFAGRARLGMAANLVGNGMLLSRRVMEQRPWDAFTGVEDLEYSMRLRLAGIRPRFAPDAVVSGPGSVTRAGVSQQRLRWEGGRFHAIRTWLWPLVAAGQLDAAIDLATPPLALLSIATGVGAFLAALAVVLLGAPVWSLVPWLVALVAIPAFVVIGLWASGSRGILKRTLVGAPGYVAWKVGTYLHLARGFDAARWDRSDRQQGRLFSSTRVEIAGVPVDVVDMPGALNRVRSAIGGTRLFQVSTINLDFVVRAQHDPEVQRIFRRSDLNLADGAPVVWLGRLLGAAMPARVAGADLIPALMAEAGLAGARVFLLGGEGGVADAAAKRLLELFPGIQIAGTYEPPRASVEDMDNSEILTRIAAAKPDVLLVAFGNPKQERWIDRHRDQLGVSVAIGVGCVFDLLAGRASRAPHWMQNAGVEWLYRLGREPRRLVGRYLIDAIWLVPITAKALRARLGSQGLAQSV